MLWWNPCRGGGNTTRTQAMADSIYVINVGGYIGESTRSEIDYATSHGKKVEYLEADCL